jgi:hypothetical protein
MAILMACSGVDEVASTDSIMLRLVAWSVVIIAVFEA